MEQNYIVAGPEFGQLEGHYLIIVKALYGLGTSGLCWHECFAYCLRNEGFSPCKAEPDIWMSTKTHTADVYPIISDKQFVNTLLDNITQCGAPTKLISDGAQVEISERVKQVL
jgi:hypothetical protein